MDALLQAMTDEFGRMPEPGALVALLRILGAALLCGVIGLEREVSDHAAGLRTNMLIGIAAATFALIAFWLIEHVDGETARVDPLRLIEAVTSGAAFLAAGLIVLARGHVRGLTTGASVWLSAAVGLSVGVGQWFLALVAAVAGVSVLVVVSKVEEGLGIAGKKNLTEPED